MLHNKNNRIMTYFIEEDIDTMIEPFDLLNKKCIVTAAVKIENIIIGKRISISVRLYEVLVRKLNTDKKVFVPKSLLKPDMAVKKIDRKKNKVPEKTTNGVSFTNSFQALELEEDEPNQEIVKEESVVESQVETENTVPVV